MSGSGAAPVSIPLRDGTQLSVTPAGVQTGASLFELGRIQDARQVSPDPETFALRVAGTGLVEFQPIRPGDGVLALEAIFRYRPDLRPAGFVGPSDTTGFLPPPPAAHPSMPGYPSPPVYGAPLAGYPPPPGYGFPPPAAPRAMYYGQSPNAGQGELTPYPRSFGELLGAVFQLYGKHFWKWLALGALVGLIPSFLGGVLQVAIYLALGLNPWGSNANLLPASAFTPTQPGTVPALPFHMPGADQLAIISIVALATFVLSILFGAWQIASFAHAAREAVLGREVRVGDSLADGLKRLFPVIGTNILVGLITIACFVPFFALFVALLIAAPTSGSASASLLLVCGGFLVLLLSLPLVVYFGIRLGFAPYVTASERMGPGTAIAACWRLSRGAWWRTFGVIFTLGLIVGFVSFIVGQVQIVSIAASVLVAVPLLAVLTAPLYALAWMVMWYDLRLRREGYAAVTQPAPAPLGTTPYGPPFSSPPTLG